MNAKDTGPIDYGDEDIEELEGQPGSNRAAPIALAVASVVVVAGILAAWFFVISPAQRDTGQPATQTERGENVVQQEQSGASAPAGESAASQSDDEVKPAAENGTVVEGEAPAAEDGDKTGEEMVARTEAEAPAEPDPAPIAPSFGTVRVESSGDAVLAGEAQAGAIVTLYAGSNKIGEAVADRGGNWAMVLDKPLPAGTSDLWISAAKAGKEEARSRQSVAVVIDPDRQAQPLVVVQEERGSRVLQQPEQEMAEAPAEMPAATGSEEESAARDVGAEGPAGVSPPAAKAPPATRQSPVVIETADYSETGELNISGSATPNATVRLYYDEAHAGDALADDKGRWSLSLKRDLDGAVHSVRADDLEPDSGKVRTRAEVSFIAKLSPEQERELSKRMAARAEKAETEGGSRMASAETGAGTTAMTAGTSGEAATTAGETSTPAAAAGETGMAAGEPASAAADGAEGGASKATETAEAAKAAADRGRITIVRGDNLWRIAREHYGRGVRYTAIFQANKDQIRNPDLIYPGQVFLIPRLQDTN